MFAWLVTIVLNESPMMVGVAQLALLFPATLLMLVGGSLSDRLGGKRVAVVSQSLAVFPLGTLAIFLLLDHLSFGVMIAYAIAIGSLQAFVTPARDGMLNSVAQGNIQRNGRQSHANPIPSTNGRLYTRRDCGYDRGDF